MPNRRRDGIGDEKHADTARLECLDEVVEFRSRIRCLDPSPLLGSKPDKRNTFSKPSGCEPFTRSGSCEP